MKAIKNFTFIFIFFYLNLALAQVGINTTTPKATLDVQGKPTLTTELDGIIPPRLTGDQLKLKNYTTNQNGTIVYVTQGATTPSGQVLNVTSSGLYVFKSSLNQWVSLTPNSSGGNVYCNSANPNSATIFDDELPVVAHDNSLIQNSDYTYFASDGTVWVWNGTTYITASNSINLSVGQRTSICRIVPNSVASNTVPFTTGLIELDGLIRVSFMKNNDVYYYPRIYNISAASITYHSQTFCTQTSGNRALVNKTLASNAFENVDSDGLVFWYSTDGNTEVETTNIILPNGKWYEIQWFGIKRNSDNANVIYMTVVRKF